MFSILLSLCAAWLSAAHGATPTTLAAAFDSALKHNENVNLQERDVAIAEERYSQAKSNLLPTIYGTASYLVQDVPSDPIAASFFPRTQPNVSVTLKQPVFRGLREYAALRQFKDLGRAQADLRNQVILDLYNEVAQSFYAVLSAQEELANLKEQRSLYHERVVELHDRAKAGTSNVTDLLTSEAAEAQVESVIQDSQARLTGLRETFSFLTGLAPDSILTTADSDQIVLKPLEAYTIRVETRGDISAAKDRYEAADESVLIAKGGHLPSIDLLGNYYLKRPDGVLSDIKWDVQATLTLPIYSGGIVVSQVREAAISREKADLELTRTRRQALQLIRTSHANLSADLASVAALKKTLVISEKNYLQLKRDYRRGLSRNLDVLQALTTTQDARRSLVRARYAALSNWVQLHVASAQFPEIKQ